MILLSTSSISSWIEYNPSKWPMSLKLFIRPTKIIGVQSSPGPVLSYTHCVWDLCVSRVVSFFTFIACPHTLSAYKGSGEVWSPRSHTGRVKWKAKTRAKGKCRRQKLNATPNKRKQTGDILSSHSFLVLTHCLFGKGVEKYGHQRSHAGRVKWKAEVNGKCRRQKLNATANIRKKQAISYLHFLFMSLHIACLEREWRSMATNGIIWKESNERHSTDAKNVNAILIKQTNRRYLIFTFFSCPRSLIVCLQSFQRSMCQVCSCQ